MTETKVQNGMLAAAPRNGQRHTPDAQSTRSLGEVGWSRADIIAQLAEFAALYQKRPIKDNSGGMKIPHMFATWFLLKRLRPRVIIESGVFLGQGTWLMEQTCPEARLHCLDIKLSPNRYVACGARYHDKDFATIDWSSLPREETLLFFDDHQNALERIKVARNLGFRHLIFEDNYPASQGDCYSLKKAFMGAGFTPPKKPARGLLGLFGKRANDAPGTIAPNLADAAHLTANLDLYYEFPPVFQRPTTRWGDPWREPTYPTPEPLLNAPTEDFHKVYWEEALHYTWLCYARLR